MLVVAMFTVYVSAIVISLVASSRDSYICKLLYAYFPPLGKSWECILQTKAVDLFEFYF